MEVHFFKLLDFLPKKKKLKQIFQSRNYHYSKTEMSSKTETTTNNRTSDISDKKVGKESSKKVPMGDVESKNTSPFPTERNSVSTPNSLFNSPSELPNMSQTNNNEIVLSQVEENNKKVEVKKSKPKKVSHPVLDPTDASISQKPKAKKAPNVPTPVEEESDDEEELPVVPVATATQMGIPVDEDVEDAIQEDMDSQSPRAMVSTEMFGVESVAEAEIVPTPIAPAELDEDDEDVELARQMAEIKRRQEEKARQKQVKQQVSKASIYRDELSAQTRSHSYDIWQELEMRKQETIRKYQETMFDLERQQNEEEQQREATLQQLREATDEQIVEFYNQREAKKKPMAKSSKTTTKKATTLASISAGGGGGSDDGSEGKVKRERSNIDRDTDKTFENCGTIVITEEYEGAKTSITLTRNRHQRTWKMGAWVNQEGVAVASPNDAWKDMIRARWGDAGLKKFNGKNVWEKVGRMVATSNSGAKYDMAKKPFMVMMNLAKCKGVYQARRFEDLSDEDFTQIV